MHITNVLIITIIIITNIHIDRLHLAIHTQVKTSSHKHYKSLLTLCTASQGKASLGLILTPTNAHTIYLERPNLAQVYIGGRG